MPGRPAAPTLAGRPAVVTLAALAVRAATLLVIVELAGPGSLGPPLHHLHWGFFALTGLAELLTFPAYLVAYRSLARLGGHRDLDVATLARIVVAGFGPLALSGGFGTDRSVLGRLDRGPERRDTQAHVAALSTLEWAVLAPIAAVCSAGLLVAGARVSGSLLWPWLVGVPVAGALALWLATGDGARRTRIRGHHLAVLERTRLGILAVGSMARHPVQFSGAWLGMLAYWICEIAALDCALHAVRLDLDLAMATLAYTTGCLGSRRSLPLGGAGLVEALFVLSLHELHQPIGPSVAAVLVYRVFNFVVGIVPAWVALGQLRGAGAS